MLSPSHGSWIREYNVFNRLSSIRNVEIVIGEKTYVGGDTELMDVL